MELLDELRALIERWVESRRNASLPMLSKQSGVSYPTVRRIYQREGEPTLNNVMSLLTIIVSPAEARQFLQRHYPEFAKIIEPSLIDPDPVTGIAELENFSAQDFLILTLSATKTGVSEEEVKERSGIDGLKSLEKLESVGAITKLKERYRTTSDTVRIVGGHRVLQSIAYLCDLFDFEHIDSRGSLFRLKTEGLTKEAVLRVYKILLDASHAIQEIHDDPKNHGEFVLGVGIVSTFLSFPQGEANL